MAKAPAATVRRLSSREVVTLCAALRLWQRSEFNDVVEECVNEFGEDIGLVTDDAVSQLIAELWTSEHVSIWSPMLKPV